MIRFSRASVLVLVATVLVFPSFGKSKGGISGNGHKGDMVRVLGVDLSNKDAKTRVNRLTDFFSAMIDEGCWPLRAAITNVAPRFSTGKARHRIFFHWGYNQLPVYNEGSPLTRAINASTDDASKREEIWQLIRNEQERRNSAMQKSVINIYSDANGRPPPFTRTEVNAIASFVYDTHIIGDHIEGTEATQLAIASITSVKSDLKTAVRNIAKEAKRDGFAGYREMNDFIDKLDKTGNSAGDAQDILNLMEEYVPQVLRASPRLARHLGVK